MDMKLPHLKPKTILYVFIGLIVFFVCASLTLFLWAQRYDERIGPNVFIGPVSVGGLTRDLATQEIQRRIDIILTEGISVVLREDNEGTIRQLPLSTLIGTDSIEDVVFDVDVAVRQAENARHSSNLFLNAWLLVSNIWEPQTVSLSIHLSQENIRKSIYALFPTKEIPAQDAKFVFFATGSDFFVTTTQDQPGKTFGFEEFFENVNGALSTLSPPTTVFLRLVDRTPTITQAIVEDQKETALRALSHTPIKLTLQTETPLAWNITKQDLASMIIPTQMGIGIDQAIFNLFLDSIAQQVEQPAQNARFQILDGRVTDFAQSKTGLRLDRETAYQSLLARIQEMSDSTDIALVLVEEKPTVKTHEVNDLGVTEMLGVGTSSYKGSPKNRRANIQNGVNLLNGRLIAPDETVSLIEFLKPFEFENGYLPELVIKGTKIIPEIGGGLCQIGTTTFRAVMNAGLEILERHNHSIVVSYYNDPANKNPGTDATIYEPAPDFKFKNDTGNYLLFQAENLLDTQELRFTFWGTSDGRKGTYKPPTVIRWIPVGEDVRTETTNIEPGIEKCQEAHTGADTTFTYTVERADGTKKDTEFTSHYRPLPRICLVGVEKIETEELHPEVPDPLLPTPLE